MPSPSIPAKFNADRFRLKNLQRRGVLMGYTSDSPSNSHRDSSVGRAFVEARFSTFIQGVTITEYKCYRFCYNHEEMAVPSPEGVVN